MCGIAARQGRQRLFRCRGYSLRQYRRVSGRSPRTAPTASSIRSRGPTAWRKAPDAGRGLFSRANWSTDGVYSKRTRRHLKTIPIDLPSMALNRLSVSGVQRTLLLGAAKTGTRRQHYTTFFYPLDAIELELSLWSPRHAAIYQCVVPFGPPREAMRALLAEITRSGQASFLAVLKTLGAIPSLGLCPFRAPA